MGTINKSFNRFDITPVFTHPGAKADVILVHGLNGDPEKTWTSKKSGVYWPADLLPKTLAEAGIQANVLAYGWNADVTKTPSQNFIHEHAQTLVNYLTSYRTRENTFRHPIIWVVHSLGGILLKRALEYSDSARSASNENYRSIYVSTRAIVFLGTPHEGSNLAPWGEMLQRMAGHVPRKIFDSEPILVKTLREDSETLANINKAFLNIQQKFAIHLVHENQKSNLKGTKRLIVESKSAAPNWVGASVYGIEADHSGMCKFDGFNAPGYRQITTAISEWVKESPETIATRWAVEDQDRRIRAQLEINERARPLLGDPSAAAVSTPVVVSRNDTASNTVAPIREAPPSPLPMLPTTQTMGVDSPRTQDSQSQTPNDPLFIHPEAFRPNSYFVGREEELKDLHAILQDRGRRLEGTSTVLIRCQTGGGKTHLARQYVFKHRYDYAGGVFWLRASSPQELEAEFWTIARTAALRDLAITDLRDLKDHTKMVDHVRRWFSGFENWLIVFDGIMFDPGMERFVPDSVNTSMILTSTSPAVTGNHHFSNPKLLELPSLSIQEAQQLLLLEMDKKKPWSQEDLRQAAELTKLLDKLPLMIHVTAQGLKMSSEPLSVYLKRYKSKPHINRRIQAYDEVLNQMYARGATAALNVLSVLAFLDQHIPVEMIAIGLRALDESTPYKTRDAATHQKPNLNNTIKVLVAYALVDRTDSYDLSPTSSRTSKRSVDLATESMDTLRVHGVIQQYLIERLVVKKDHHFWLEQTCEVFLRAYQDADARMKKDNPKIGLPDDYRRFSLHGNKLVCHLSRYEKKVDGKQPLKTRLEEHMRQMDAERQRLQEEIQNKIVNQSGEIPQLSVFDRANSLSESDSGTTSSQNHSQETWTPLENDMSNYVLSPVAIDSHRLPYPEEEDDNPTPHDTPRQGWDQPVAMPDERGFQAVAPKDQQSKQQKSNSGLINKNERHQTSAEVMVTHETVETPMNFFHWANRRGSRASSKGRLFAQSEAELSLAQIRQKSPTPPRGGGLIQDRGRSGSSGSGPRPKDFLSRGEFNRAGVASGLTPTDELSHADFSQAVGGAAAPSALQMLKDSILPMGRRRKSSASSNSRTSLQDIFPFARRKSSASSISRLSLQVPSSIHTSPGVDQVASVPPFPILPARSSRSSPGQGVSPFYPPDPLGQRSPEFDVRRNLPPSFQQWATTDAPYQPGRLSRIDSSNVGLNPMALPLPYPERRYQQQGTGNMYSPAAWLQSQEGPTSVPMSRGSSHPSSNPSYHSRHRSSADSVRGSAAGITRTTQRSRRNSSPPSSPVSTVPPPFSRPRGGYSRPPSIATEPSPRVKPRYDVMDSPCPPAIPQRRGSGAGMLMMPMPFDSIPGAGTGAAPLQLPGPIANVPGASTGAVSMPPRPAAAVVPVRPQGLYKRRWSRFRGGHGRARSVDVRMPRSQGASAGAGASPDGAAVAVAVAGGEAMMRSGSGGIVVGQGRGRQIIEFGEVPVDMDAAAQRLRDRRERRERHQQQQQQQQEEEEEGGGDDRSPITISRDGSGGVGLGIMADGSAHLEGPGLVGETPDVM